MKLAINRCAVLLSAVLLSAGNAHGSNDATEKPLLCPDGFATTAAIARDNGMSSLDALVGTLTSQVVAQVKPVNPLPAAVQDLRDRIRRDLAQEWPDLRERLRQVDSADTDRLTDRVLSRLNAAESASLHAYFDSDAGQHYEVFMSRLDALSGWRFGCVAPTPIPGERESTGVETSDSAPDQVLLAMMMLSDTAQVRAAEARVRKDPSRAAGLGFVFSMFLGRLHDPLERLYRDYERDLSGFQQFQSTEPAQRLFEAMTAALDQQSPPWTTVSAEVLKRHGAAWKRTLEQQLH